MFEHAEAAVDAAIAAGARYADARVMDRRHESMVARNGEVEGLNQEQSVGIGVRALIGSGWGFASTADLDAESAGRAGAQAATIARASASVPAPTWSSPRSRSARTPGRTRCARGSAARAAVREGGHARLGHAHDARARRRHGERRIRHLGHHEVVGQPRATGSTSGSWSAGRPWTRPPTVRPRRSDAAIPASAASTARADGSSSASSIFPVTRPASPRRREPC